MALRACLVGARQCCPSPTKLVDGPSRFRSGRQPPRFRSGRQPRRITSVLGPALQSTHPSRRGGGAEGVYPVRFELVAPQRPAETHAPARAQPPNVHTAPPASSAPAATHVHRPTHCPHERARQPYTCARGPHCNAGNHPNHTPYQSVSRQGGREGRGRRIRVAQRLGAARGTCGCAARATLLPEPHGPRAESGCESTVLSRPAAVISSVVPWITRGEARAHATSPDSPSRRACAHLRDTPVTPLTVGRSALRSAARGT